jgi:hypothetical protein
MCELTDNNFSLHIFSSNQIDVKFEMCTVHITVDEWLQAHLCMDHRESGDHRVSFLRKSALVMAAFY